MRKLLFVVIFLLCKQMLYSQKVFKVYKFDVGHRTSKEDKFQYEGFRDVTDIRIIFDGKRYNVTDKANSEYTLFGKGNEVKGEYFVSYGSKALDEKSNNCDVSLNYYDNGGIMFFVRYPKIAFMYMVTSVNLKDN